MERDDELKGEGNSYDFGARINDVRIGKWLSVDALARNFPSKSPYNSMSNNPIIRIDPDGNADIYYNGKWIGTDGIDDNLVVIAKSSKVKKEVLKNTKKGLHYTGLGLKNGEVNSKFKALDRNILNESVSVTKKAIKTKGDNREHLAVMEKDSHGNYTTTYRHSPPEDIFTATDGTKRTRGGELPEGDVSIHSHPIGLIPNSDGTFGYHRAEVPSPTDDHGDGDVGVFEDYELNIITGSVGVPKKDSRTGEYIIRAIRIILFNSHSEEKMRINYGNAAKIVDDKNKVNQNAKRKFEKKQTE